MKFDKLGWIVAAGLAGAMVTAGFQTANEKVAMVDMVKAFNDCDLSKKLSEDLRTTNNNYMAVMEFINQNPAMKIEDAEKYSTLAAKLNPTGPEKAEIERISTDAKAVTAKRSELMTKQPLSEAESKQLADFATRASAMNQFRQQLAQRLDANLSELQGTMRQQTVEKIRLAVKNVAGKQGYTVVFSQDATPYAANDLTADVVKSMNANNK